MKPVLVILDFSGTLSLGAAVFGRSANLEQALRDTGFSALGLADPDAFWQDVIDPTWKQGGTGKLTYTACLIDGVRRALPHLDPKTLSQAADRFTAAYYARSTIDDAWQPALREWTRSDGVVPLVATDNYREATPTLVDELRRMGLKGMPVLDEAWNPESFAVAIANSADLGCVKSTTSFWSAAREALGSYAPSDIVLIDDFGCNETSHDAYAARDTIAPRQQRTTSLLQEVFGIECRTVPFTLGAAARAGAAAGRDADASGMGDGGGGGGGDGADERQALIAQCRRMVQAALQER